MVEVKKGLSQHKFKHVAILVPAALENCKPNIML